MGLTRQMNADSADARKVERAVERERMRPIAGTPGEVLVPIVAAVAVGDRRLFQIQGYRPAQVGPTPEAGMYLAASGYVTDPAAATDFRARPVTAEEIAVVMAAYFAANPVAPGKNATDQQVASAVSAWLAANPPKAGDAGAPKRVETVSGVLAANASVKLTFAKAFAEIPVVIPEPTWVGQQLVMPIVGAVTKTDVTLTAMQSRGTLLLTDGPFQPATAGKPVSVKVIGS